MRDARKLADYVRSVKGVVVTTNGCFDILHAGHVKYLEYARSLGDCLIVGINSDESVRRLKGPTRPINTAEHRAAVLIALKWVDAVCVFEEDTPIEWLKTIRPQFHIKGRDYSSKPVPESDIVRSWGGYVKIALPFVDGLSTTSLVKKASEIST